MLVDDLESRGNSRSVFGPVASDVIKKRFAEASLGLRPTLKRKQLKDYEQADSAKNSSPSLGARSSTLPHVNEQAGSDGLGSLRLAARVMAILHSLHIRSLQDLRTANEKILAKHLTMTEIKELKKRSGALNEPPKSPLLLTAAKLPRRIVQVLNAMGVMTIADLAEVSEAKLRAQPKLGKTEMLAILRVCHEHGLRLKGG
jgi:hypothetical protein